MPVTLFTLSPFSMAPEFSITVCITYNTIVSVILFVCSRHVRVVNFQILIVLTGLNVNVTILNDD